MDSVGPMASEIVGCKRWRIGLCTHSWLLTWPWLLFPNLNLREDMSMHWTVGLCKQQVMLQSYKDLCWKVYMWRVVGLLNWPPMLSIDQNMRDLMRLQRAMALPHRLQLLSSHIEMPDKLWLPRIMGLPSWRAMLPTHKNMCWKVWVYQFLAMLLGRTVLQQRMWWMRNTQWRL